MKTRDSISMRCPGCGTPLTMETNLPDGEPVVCPVCDKRIISKDFIAVTPVPGRNSNAKLNSRSGNAQSPASSSDRRKKDKGPASLIAISVVVIVIAWYMIWVAGGHPVHSSTEGVSVADTKGIPIPQNPAATAPPPGGNPIEKPSQANTLLDEPKAPPPLPPTAAVEDASKTPVVKPEEQQKQIPSPPESGNNRIEKSEAESKPARSTYPEVKKPDAIPATLVKRIEFFRNWEHIIALARAGKTIKDEVILDQATGPLWIKFSDIGKMIVEDQSAYMSISEQNNRIDIYAMTKDRERFGGMPGTPIITLQTTHGNYTTDDKVRISCVSEISAPPEVRLPNLFAITEIIADGKLYSTKETWQAIVKDMDKNAPRARAEIRLNDNSALIVYQATSLETELLRDNKLAIGIEGCVILPSNNLPSSSRNTSKASSLQSSDSAVLIFRSKAVDAEAVSIATAILALKKRAAAAQSDYKSSYRSSATAVSFQDYLKRQTAAEARRLGDAIGLTYGSRELDSCVDSLLNSQRIQTLEDLDSLCNGEISKKLKSNKLEIIRGIKVK